MRGIRPATAATARPEAILNDQTTRPQSAPTNRPALGVKKTTRLDPNIAAHCARVRTLANQPKMSSGDREALAALLDAFELVKRQKDDAVDRVRETSMQNSGMMMESAEMREKLAGAEHLIAEYKKLDIVAEMMRSDALVESIAEINATEKRYNPAAQIAATLEKLPADDDTISSANGSINGGRSGPPRPASPTALAMVAKRGSLAGSPAPGTEEEDIPAGLQTHALLEEKVLSLLALLVQEYKY
jgi:hypothetical protein